MPDNIPEFLRVISAFNSSGLEYMVVGGYAVNYYGYSRTTGDIDVYLKDSLENRKKLVKALDELGYGTSEMLMSVPILAGYCEIMMDDGMYMDLMTQIPGIDPARFDNDLLHCERSEVLGVEIRYIGFEQLIKNKETTGRKKDLLDVDTLKALRK